MEDAVARGRLPESVLATLRRGVRSATLRPLPARRAPAPRLPLRLSADDRGPASGRDRRIPGLFAGAAARAQRRGVRRGRAALRPRVHDGVVPVGHERAARTTTAAASRTGMRLPLEVVRAVRGRRSARVRGGLPLPGVRGHPGRGRRVRGNTLDGRVRDRRGAGAGRPRLPLASRAAASSRTRCSRPSGEAAYPYTGHSGHTCIPRGKHDPFGVNVPLAAGIRAAVRAAGFTTPVVASGKIVGFEQAEAILARGDADLVGMARALLADPDLPRKWRARRGSGRADLRVLPVLRAGGPAPPPGHVHAVAEGPGRAAVAGDPGAVALPVTFRGPTPLMGGGSTCEH